MADISRIKIGDSVYNINDSTARGQISALSETVATKADASNVYTKSEIIAAYATKESVNDKVSTSAFTDYQTSVTEALSGKMSTSDGLTKTEAANTYATQTALSSKVDSSVYSAAMSTVNDTLAGKADSSSVYDKTAADGRFASIGSLNDYTTTSVFNSTIETIEGNVADKADANDVYDKDTADARFASISDLNSKVDTSTMNSAIAGVQGSFASELAGVQGTLAELSGRIDILDGSGDTLETIAKIQAELNDPDNAGGLVSFLDTVKAAMNSGEVIDNDHTYSFEVGAQGTENEGTLMINSNLVQTSTRVWVPASGNQGSQGA